MLKKVILRYSNFKYLMVKMWYTQTWIHILFLSLYNIEILVLSKVSLGSELTGFRKYFYLFK